MAIFQLISVWLTTKPKHSTTPNEENDSSSKRKYFNLSSSPKPTDSTIQITPRQRAILKSELDSTALPLSKARYQDIAAKAGLPEKVVRDWVQKRPVINLLKPDDNSKSGGHVASKSYYQPDVLPKQDTITGLTGKINGIPASALPDTGAEMNFMAATFATNFGLDFALYTKGAEPSFVMGHGRLIKAIGAVTINWEFQKELEKTYPILVYILADCIFGFMIGGAFLFSTDTMSIHQDRLTQIPKPWGALRARFVNLCGIPTRKLCGALEKRRCIALPDSGAEPNLLSYEYTKRRGWLLYMFPGP